MKYSTIPQALLNGGRIRLIPPALKRAKEMHALICNFDLTHKEFLTWANQNISLEETYLNMQKAKINFKLGTSEYKFLIIEKGSQLLVGCISLFIRNPSIPSFEIGYWIGSNSRGNGYAAEACGLIRKIATTRLKAKRVEIKTARRNVRSIKVAERCGFQLEMVIPNARFDNAGVMDDTCIYAYPM
ncbi:MULTISPECIES: GNAT family N-acetyltransferase [unclassified Pseudomonas]|uniref:GNAT family N-acetyltransferase n=1 Tax=unclassified Pseudomonas TaxID=196821 RepID=UPI000F55A49C|nr:MULTISPECIES: GNAT family N-acetyltransferase [unclassified Pseudomonas]AZF50151.1 hypothetical protein C4J86_4964 [Pseudomonas sp. R2-7-07]AZF60659.1 hypothetical protein C4J84_4830 [Pseudomonas sp. R11-23-07]